MSACQESCCHNYSAYSRGCRCPVCREAKAAYMRQRRAEAAMAARLGVAVDGVTHGTRSAYEEGGCRCIPCLRAQYTSSRHGHAWEFAPAGDAA